MTLRARTVDSPIGPLLVVAGPRGLARIAFAGDDHDRVLAGLGRVGLTRTTAGSHTDDPTAEVARQLDEFFERRRRHFDLPLDSAAGPVGGFRPRVWAELRRVPFAATVSYGELARRAGRPGAARAAGTACATNPVPVVVPCHRVVRSDGTVGQYRGGVEAKEWLVAFERSVAETEPSG